jgi:hypothetical protein
VGQKSSAYSMRSWCVLAVSLRSATESCAFLVHAMKDAFISETRSSHSRTQLYAVRAADKNSGEIRLERQNTNCTNPGLPHTSHNEGELEQVLLTSCHLG